MSVQIIECTQGEPDWFAARCGLVTASELSSVIACPKADGVLPQAVIDSMIKSGCTAAQLAEAIKAAKKKYSNASATRTKYLRRLAGEVITGEPTESYTNGFMERGKEMEAEARDWYAFTRGCEPQQIGFMVNGRMGYSPDSLVGDDGLLEIKTALPDIVIEAILRDEPGKDAFPPEHRAQCQGGLLVSERKWIDIVIYHPKMPRFVIRATPDNSYIATLRDEIARFNTDLDALVERIRRYEPRAA